MSRRLPLLCAGGALLLAAFGCGASGPSVSAGSQPTAQTATGATGATVATVTTGAAVGSRVVEYQGVQFDVPGDWPVYDLAAAPTTCVRFDVHAVYLGHAGADQQCPAGLVGRSDAILVEPADGDVAQGTAAGVSSQTVNGLEVDVAAGAAVSHEIDATIPALGVAVTITYRDADATAQGILQSLRATGP